MGKETWEENTQRQISISAHLITQPAQVHKHKQCQCQQCSPETLTITIWSAGQVFLLTNSGQDKLHFYFL